MAIKKLARSFLKIFYLFFLLFLAGRITPSPEQYISYEIARKVSLFISENESAEDMYDAYSYIDLGILLVISITIYISTMKLIKILRRK